MCEREKEREEKGSGNLFTPLTVLFEYIANLPKTRKLINTNARKALVSLTRKSIKTKNEFLPSTGEGNGG